MFGCSPGLLQLPLSFKVPQQGPLGPAVPQVAARRREDGADRGGPKHRGGDHGEAVLGQLIDEGLAETAMGNHRETIGKPEENHRKT